MRTLFLLFSLMTISLPLQAGVIPLINAGFEDPDIGGGSILWDGSTVVGWNDSDVVPFGATLLHPNSGVLPYEGDQMLHFQVSNQFGNKHVQQNTSELIAANTVYTASVYLASRDSGTATGTIELVAGNTILASATAVLDAFNITGQRWHRHEVTFTTGLADASLGEQLGIRLYRAHGHASADFDAVGLTSEELGVPTGPATLMFLLGLIGVGLGHWRRLHH